MCLRVRRILLVVGSQIIGCAAEALHRWRHFEFLYYVGWSRMVERSERLSWAQRDARLGERLG
jgi:hypothetical protein